MMIGTLNIQLRSFSVFRLIDIRRIFVWHHVYEHLNANKSSLSLYCSAVFLEPFPTSLLLKSLFLFSVVNSTNKLRTEYDILLDYYFIL